MSWPEKPPKTDLNAWYREMEKGLVLSVLSADAEDSRCPTCGKTRIIYQHQDVQTRQIHAACKDCTLEKAGGRELIWVRTGSLRETWREDGRNAKRQTRKKAEERTP